MVLSLACGVGRGRHVVGTKTLAGFEDVQVGQVPVPLVDVEAVADEELVRDGEADVAHRQVLDEAPVGPVEQRHGRERARRAQPEASARGSAASARCRRRPRRSTTSRPSMLGVQVLEEPDRRRAAGLVGACSRRARRSRRGAGSGSRASGRRGRRSSPSARRRAAARGRRSRRRSRRRARRRGRRSPPRRGRPRRCARRVGCADRAADQVRQEASFRPYRWARRSMSRL